jgi:hypothetical protein
MPRYTALLAATLLAGCAGSSAPTQIPASSQTGAQALSRTAQFDACDTAAHAMIRAGGGQFALPACAGWKGKIVYPPTTGTTYRWLATSSTTNSFGAPPPPSGTAIFYMQTARTVNHGSGATFQNTGATDTVTSTAFRPSATYTLIVYGLYTDDQCPSAPPSCCPPWTQNVGAASGNHSITFGSPLNGAVVNGDTVWQFVQN